MPSTNPYSMEQLYFILSNRKSIYQKEVHLIKEDAHTTIIVRLIDGDRHKKTTPERELLDVSFSLG